MSQAKITPEQKEEIRTLYASGAFTQVQLAEKFGPRDCGRRRDETLREHACAFSAANAF